MSKNDKVAQAAVDTLCDIFSDDDRACGEDCDCWHGAGGLMCEQAKRMLEAIRKAQGMI
jgi:hypothetical protein